MYEWFQQINEFSKWCNASMWCWRLYTLSPSIELNRFEPCDMVCQCVRKLENIEQCSCIILVLSFEFWLFYNFTILSITFAIFDFISLFYSHSIFTCILMFQCAMKVDKHHTIHSFKPVIYKNNLWFIFSNTIWLYYGGCSAKLVGLPHVVCMYFTKLKGFTKLQQQ